jgi:hypothetical protein
MVQEGDKVVTSFIGPFRIQEKIGPIAYHLVLPPHLHKTHNVFHVSVLRHYVADESHKLNWKELQVSDVGTLIVEPLCILDRRVQQLKNHLVDQVKVQWDKYSPGSCYLGRCRDTTTRLSLTFLTTSRICFLKVGCM